MEELGKNESEGIASGVGVRLLVMMIKFIHKPVNHFLTIRCLVSVPFKPRGNEVDSSH